METAVKGVSADSLHTRWNHHSGQFTATVKSNCFDLLQAFRECDANQAVAVKESPFSNARHAVRNRNTGQAVTIQESKVCTPIVMTSVFIVF